MRSVGAGLATSNMVEKKLLLCNFRGSWVSWPWSDTTFDPLPVSKSVVCGHAKFGKQWGEKALVTAPAANGDVVDRLADLSGTSGENGPLRLMEGEATRIPSQPTMGDDPPRLPFNVSDQILVVNIENTTGRQHLMPMGHERLVVPIISAKFAQLVGVILFSGKQLGETGQTRVRRIPNGMDYSCLWQRVFEFAFTARWKCVISPPANTRG